MRQLVATLEARPDVTLKRGSKHLRVISAEGRQLAVISRGSQSNRGRDAKNILATLRRNGIELEGGTMKTAPTKGPHSGAAPARVAALKKDGQAVMALLEMSKTDLADAIFDVQDKVIVGGQKYKNRDSLRETIYRLYRSSGGRISDWGADVIEAAMTHLIDGAAAAVSAAAEEITEEASEVMFKGRVVIMVDGDGKRLYVEEELEQARVILEQMVEEFRVHYGYEATEAFPHGKGTFSRIANWAIAWAEETGHEFNEGRSGEVGIAATFPNRVARFISAVHYPTSSNRADMLWLAREWAEARSDDERFELPYSAPAVRDEETKSDEASEVEAQITHAWYGVEDEQADVRLPLHIRIMGALIYGTDKDVVQELAYEVMLLEQKVNGLR